MGWKKRGKTRRHLAPAGATRGALLKSTRGPVSIRALSGVCPACVRGFGGARSLAVGFAAVFYGGDADDVSVVMEADAVVAYPQPELRRLDVLETLNVAFAGFQIVGQRMENTEGSGLIDGAKLSLGLVVP